MRSVPALALASILSLVALGSLSTAGSAGPPSEPVKVVVLVVDGLHPDEVSVEDAPTLAELKGQGTWYQQARSIFVAETIPNHVAMMTGSYGKRSGIPVNSFWNRAADGEVGVDMQDPRLLRADTMFTAIQRQCSELRTAAILSKTYLHGIFSGDHDSDGEIDADVLWDPSGVALPASDHAPDIFTTEETLAEIPNEPDLLFVNLGDVDRSGHADPSGVQDAAVRRGVLKNTDMQVKRIVDALKAQGTWGRTVMFVVSDHSMDWSAPQDYISLDEVYAADPRTAGKYEVIQNGGVDNVYLKPGTKQKLKVRAAMYKLAKRTDGVAGVYYRKFNPGHRKGQLLRREWHLRSTRVGDVIAFAEPGRRFSDPSSSSNPIPGNHGHAMTRHAVALVTGGSPLVNSQDIPPSLVEAVDPLDDTELLPEQSEQVDVGVTVAWLLGVEDPGIQQRGVKQFQGRALTEAFSAQPAPACN